MKARNCGPFYFVHHLFIWMIEGRSKLYIPSGFHETSMDSIRAVIAYAPLACIIANTDQGLLANHIPLIMDKDGKLIGHVALANDIHKICSDKQEVLVIFKGDDSYISPNWYPSKAVHHEHVPTWNYQVVHITGHLSFQHDMPSKRRSVSMLTHHFERKINGDEAWKMGDAPAEYLTNELEDIVALEITVDHIAAKSKLSQNQTSEDRKNVATKLEEYGKTRMSSKICPFE